MEDWTFDSIESAEPIGFQLQQSNQPTISIMIPAEQPYTAVIMKDHEEELGRLDVSTGVLKFEGRVDESAAALLVFLKPLMDKYLAGRI